MNEEVGRGNTWRRGMFERGPAWPQPKGTGPPHPSQILGDPLHMSTCYDKQQPSFAWCSNYIRGKCLQARQHPLPWRKISLRFNGHFPGEPGLAGVYWSKGWWKWWWQLDYWSYKSCKAPVKSSPATNQQPDAGCPSCRPTNSVKALKGKISHSMDLLTPSSPGDLPTLSLTLAENICEKCWRVICLW